jgi:citrate lyase subunit beta/citryl-CoA lyase
MSHAGQPHSYLFVPASTPDRIPKALATHAHRVIVDLEDGVGFPDKESARNGLTQLGLEQPVVVRINALGTPYFEADVEATRDLPWVDAIMLPKVESALHVERLRSLIPARIAILALVESALGIVRLDEIAAARPGRLIFGSADYLADIGAPFSTEVLSYPRTRLVIASRAFSLPTPVDGPAIVMKDVEAIRADSGDARALGMGAKLCIHPAQVDVVNEVFGISDEQRRWATAVLAEAERHSGAFSFEGDMIDEPILKRARLILTTRDDERSIVQ